MIGITLVTAATYAIGIGTLVWSDRAFATQELPTHIANLAMAGLGITAIFAAVFGAAAFAVERRDRSAEFLAMLPTSRGRILLSKLIVALSCLAVVWTVNLCILRAMNSHVALGLKETYEQRLALAGAMGATLMMFGLGWLFSTFLRGAAIAFSLAFAITVASVPIVSDIAERIGLVDYGRVKSMIGVAVCVGLIGFCAGTIHYVQRVEP